MTGHCGDSSVQGQKRKSRPTILMSALPPKADINHTGCDVRYVPTRDIRGIRMTGRIWHVVMPVNEPSTASKPAVPVRRDLSLLRDRPILLRGTCRALQGGERCDDSQMPYVCASDQQCLGSHGANEDVGISCAANASSPLAPAFRLGRSALCFARDSTNTQRKKYSRARWCR